MSKITSIHARQILDSRGNPTVEVDVTLDDGSFGRAAVPSGASTGTAEAVELRDNDSTKYNGKGVLTAVNNVNSKIKDTLIGQNANDQEAIDHRMISLDGTENKGKLGGNAIVATSMAVCRAAAISSNLPLYKYFGELSGNNTFELPQPQLLILEGGKHGNWATDCQEFFVIPKREKFESFAEMLRVGTEIFHALEKILDKKGYATGVGLEGAFCPQEMSSNEEAFELLSEATEKAGYQIGEQIIFGTDAAASEFYTDGNYVLKSEGNLKLTGQEWIDKIVSWTKQYPLWSLEDMLDEEDWDNWVILTEKLGADHQIVGDDLLTTNVKRIQKGIELHACNSVLIKLNQIGTVTETLNAITLSDEAGYTTIVSHRGGESNDDMIADLVVGTSSWQSKFGGPDRGERVAKYNQLLRIEEELTK